MANIHGNVLPPGFENIHFGMKWEEFLQARPNAFISSGPHPNEIPDPKKPREGLMETSESGLFNTAQYLFKDGHLRSAVFVFRFESNFSHDLLTSVLEKHGKYKEVASSKDTDYATIKWVAGELNIYLTVPMEDSANEDSVLGYSIMDMEISREFEAIRADRLDLDAL